MAKTDDERAPEGVDDGGADELPDRLVLLTGFYAGCSLRLDRGPVQLSDEPGGAMRLNAGYYRGTRLIVSRTTAPDGTKRLEAFSIDGRAIFNERVRTRQFRLSHGSTIELPPVFAKFVTLRFKVAEEGRYVDEDSYPCWWYFTNDMHNWERHPLFRP